MNTSAAPQLSDEQLLLAFRNGSSSAMGQLYTRYAEKAYFKCLSMVRDTNQAYDLAQEAMLKAFDKAASYQGKAAFSTWLYTIVSNHCLDHLRKQRKYKQQAFSPAMDWEAEESSWDTELEWEQLRLTLEELLQQLPASDRELLLSKYRDNQPIRELCLRLGLKTSAVKMRLKRIRERLQAMHLTHHGSGRSPIAA